MHLINNNDTQIAKINIAGKKIIIGALFLILVFFLWQYNFLPFLINAQINKASSFIEQKNCHEAFLLMEKILPAHSYTDSYARLEYGGFVRKCASYYPENALAFVKRGAEVVNEAIKIQPLYTRYWIFMGDAMTIVGANEKDLQVKNNFITLANGYYDKALQLAPRHQEILIGRARLGIVAKDYNSVKNSSEVCILLNPNLGDCYWYLALSKIYQKDITGAKRDMQTASDKKYNIASKESLDELSNAYGAISDYNNLLPIYEGLSKSNPRVAQYHSSLAFVYKELGQYDKAREEALLVLELSPESKPNVDAFLKTLP